MGAPKGNTNALKHGLYAKHFSLEEQVRLRRMKPEDLQHEILMMRVAVKNVFEAQVRLHGLLDEADESDHPYNVDGLAKMTNSLAVAVTALNTTLRTYALFNGKEAKVTDALEQALDSMKIFLEDTYLNNMEDE